MPSTKPDGGLGYKEVYGQDPPLEDLQLHL